MKKIESILGPNWRTTLTGGITVLAGAIATNHDLVAFLPEPWRKAVTGIAGLVSILAGGAFAAVAKDGAVTGNGTAFEPHKIAQADGGNRVLAPKAPVS